MIDARSMYVALRTDGFLRGKILWRTLLVVAFPAVFAWGFWAYWQQADEQHRNVSKVAFATVGLFTGGYTQLSNDPGPSATVGLAGVVAVGCTLATAGSLLLLSKRVSDFVRLRLHPHSRLVVIGDGKTAAALVESSFTNRIRTVLVTESRESDAARATNPSIPIIATGQLESALMTSSGRRILQHANHVAIATDSDSRNMALSNVIHSFREDNPDLRESTTPTDLVVIHNPEYAQLLSPNVIRDALPANEVTCPAENIAEHICHLIIAAANGKNEVDGVVVEIVDVTPEDSGGGPEPGVTSAVTVAVERLTWSMSFVRGQQEGETDDNRYKKIPGVRLRSSSSEIIGAGDLLVQILTGDSAKVAATVFTGSNAAALRIAVAPMHLIAGAGRFRDRASTTPTAVIAGGDWLENGAEIAATPGGLQLPILVVDPDAVGLDAVLVTDDTGTQWARTFDVTYGLMYSDGTFAVTGWQPGAPMGESTRQVEKAARDAVARHPGERRKDWNDRKNEKAKKARKKISDRYSSKLAVEHMLKVLGEMGLQLCRWDGPGVPPSSPLTAADVDTIAQKEHGDWKDRFWYDTSRGRRRKLFIRDHSTSGAAEYTFAELVEIERADKDGKLRYAANYNRRIATETYPAIAASFGYAIVRIGDSVEATTHLASQVLQVAESI